MGGAVGALLSILLGLFFYAFKFGEGLNQLSYDFPFALRQNIPVNEVVVIKMDELSHKALDQPFTQPWDRSLHARLVDMLMSNHCRAVVFDIIFSDPNVSGPAADQQLIRAFKQSRKVVLAADYLKTQSSPGIFAYTPDLPCQGLRQAAATFGNAKFSLDSDFGIRQQYPNLVNIPIVSEFPTLSWSVAKLVDAPITRKAEAANALRWVNYYGPPGQIPSISYCKVFEYPPNFFSNKVVFVGSSLATGFSGENKDTFATSYSRWGAGFSAGVEIHATMFLNLLRGDWVSRLPAFLEITLLILVGLVAGYGLTRFQALVGLAIALGVVLLLTVTGHWLMWYQKFWYAWMIPVAVQIPAAFTWAITFNSVQSFIQRKVLQQSLSLYLPPSRVKQIISNPSLLKPGAEQKEISIMFTDIANYSTISQRLSAEALVPLLNEYFDLAIKAIHANDGTVIKFIGDAVFAIWNAPETQPDHPTLACRAVLKFKQDLLAFDQRNHKYPSFFTRIGLHSGPAYVGNFGGSQRFDYTAIGDAVNLAARLESLNKHLGTSVLMSDVFHLACKDEFVTRCVGHFRVKGFDKIVVIHELVGDAAQGASTHPWRDAFEKAWGSFSRQDFVAAEKGFQMVIDLRRQADLAANPESKTFEDGPAKFYLREIQKHLATPPGANWMGEVSLEEK